MNKALKMQVLYVLGAILTTLMPLAEKVKTWHELATPLTIIAILLAVKNALTGFHDESTRQFRKEDREDPK